ncbi:Ornithine decarboxylase [Trichoplax sp. H2]|nr:Ornithine decarboxylase [Trichoplax sp. H2]|eukprot:RDD38514.1 Ornithine decarboxylase [Trichoplax sp. H2]
MSDENAALKIVPTFVVSELVSKVDDDDGPFFIANIGDVVDKVNKWRKLMPRIEPFYAIKCNDNLMLLTILHSLGVGFSAVSKNEIEKVIKIGARANQIFYSNPCKPRFHLKFAASHKVQFMTFDNVSELYKIKKLCPEAKLLLRLMIDDSDTHYQLGSKYGVEIDDVSSVLQTAQQLQLNVVGISHKYLTSFNIASNAINAVSVEKVMLSFIYHIGHGRTDTSFYISAIKIAKTAFNYGKSAGYNFNILNIGGGFPGYADSIFEKICVDVNKALDEHFPLASNVKIISSAGRYFAASAFHLTVSVVSKRELKCSRTETSEVKSINTESKRFMYYINDALHVSFDMGAYALTLHTSFNGLDKASVYHFIDRKTWDAMKDKLLPYFNNISEVDL